MLVQVKYILKSEPKSLRQMRKAEFLVDTEEDGRSEFNEWVVKEHEVDLKDVLVMSVRDASTDRIKLDVKDTTIEAQGKV